MLTESKIETIQGLCVVALTKHLMKRFKVQQDRAYAKLILTELYKLLMDSDTRLYLETNDYLCTALDKEIDAGIEELYDYINKE